MSDIFTISSDILPTSTRVAGFRGTEALSKLYVFEIFLVMMNDEANDFDMAAAVNARATLTLDRGDPNPPFVFHGIFSSVELVHAFGKRSVFRAALVPQFWRLTQTFHSRIFTSKSIPDIIKAVLQDSGLTDKDFTFALLQSYKPEEHVCQYRESNYDFIARWMEREGMYFYFEQGESGEKLVIADDKSSHVPLASKPVRYFPQTGADVSAGESFRSFACRHTSLPANVRLKDYDYAKPSLDVSGSAIVSASGLGEINVYGARFFTPADGQRLAAIRSQEMLAREVVVQAHGTTFYLRPGYLFELDEHPRAALNARYLTIGLEHFGNQTAWAPEIKDLLDTPFDDVYRVEVTAIPAKSQFRAESRTAWPRIYGFENANIDGPASSEYAQIDDHGRYAVKFKFDEGTLKDGKASTWVRMMQPHGGGIEGFHFPLRKGTEIVISFLGGDPDRPVISGVVPNTLTPSPVTSGNHTKNVIQTGGRNRLELEDLSGQQRVTLSTPYSNTYLRMGAPNDGHELIVKTDENTLLDAGLQFDMQVGIQGGSGNWDIDVQDSILADVMTGDVTSTIHAGDVTTTVTTGDVMTNVNTGSMTTTVKTNVATTVTDGNMTTNVNTGLMDTTVKQNYTVTVQSGNTKVDTQAGTTEVLSKGNVTIKSSGGDITIDAETGKMTINAKSGMDITSTGDISVKGAQKWYQYTAGDYFKFNISSGVSLTLGLSSETKVALANENFFGGKLSMSLAATADLFAGIKFEAMYGVSISLKAGAYFENNVAVKAETAPAAFKIVGSQIRTVATQAWIGAMRLMPYAMTIM